MSDGGLLPHQQRSLDALLEARDKLITARHELGNDHPAYGLLGHMLDHTFEAEYRYVRDSRG